MYKLLQSIVVIFFTLTSLSLQAIYFDDPTQFEQVSQEQIVDINKADADTLIQLKGIGKAKAKAIIEYRKLNGSFTSVEELLEVKGIGEQVLELNKASITL
jgi:competence protein ComEA